MVCFYSLIELELLFIHSLPFVEGKFRNSFICIWSKSAFLHELLVKLLLKICSPYLSMTDLCVYLLSESRRGYRSWGFSVLNLWVFLFFSLFKLLQMELKSLFSLFKLIFDSLTVINWLQIHIWSYLLRRFWNLRLGQKSFFFKSQCFLSEFFFSQSGLLVSLLHSWYCFSGINFDWASSLIHVFYFTRSLILHPACRIQGLVCRGLC